jgi:hypothetical protein
MAAAVLKDPKKRTFAGLVYTHSGGRPRDKKEAEELAKELRSWGNLARVVPSKKFEDSFIVYMRGTSHETEKFFGRKPTRTKNRYKKRNLTKSVKYRQSLATPGRSTVGTR